MIDPIRFAYVKLADLQARAPHRPAGYLDDFTAVGKHVGEGILELPRITYDALRLKYTPPPAIIRPAGVQAVTAAPRTGPELWAALHTARDPSPALVAAVRADLGCGDCLIHFDAMLLELPPVYAPLPAWRRRVGQWHNRVNRRRGVREWSPAESDARWPL